VLVDDSYLLDLNSGDGGEISLGTLVLLSNGLLTLRRITGGRFGEGTGGLGLGADVLLSVVRGFGSRKLSYSDRCRGGAGGLAEL
jgi:hypothetical protein